MIPAAQSSDARAYAAEVWRVVEAQNRCATMRLTDSLDDQRLLEELIDEVKPPAPADAAGLHYLLQAPFRYAPYPNASRFRRANAYPGVFYAAEAQVTAMRELAFYRLLFFHEAPGAALPARPVELTVFAASCSADRAFDLTEPPLSAHADLWTHLTDYAACHGLTDQARALDVAVIRYQSARHPEGRCVAMLTPAAFAKPEPVRAETWRLFVRPTKVQAWREFPPAQFEFDAALFSDDPRLSAITAKSAEPESR